MRCKRHLLCLNVIQRVLLATNTYIDSWIHKCVTVNTGDGHAGLGTHTCACLGLYLCRREKRNRQAGVCTTCSCQSNGSLSGRSPVVNISMILPSACKRGSHTVCKCGHLHTLLFHAGVEGSLLSHRRKRLRETTECMWTHVRGQCPLLRQPELGIHHWNSF